MEADQIRRLLEQVESLKDSLDRTTKERDRFAEKYISVCESEGRLKEKFAVIKADLAICQDERDKFEHYLATVTKERDGRYC